MLTGPLVIATATPSFWTSISGMVLSFSFSFFLTGIRETNAFTCIRQLDLKDIGYRNRNPQSLSDSSARLMYLRVYDSRVSSHQPAPSPSLCYLLTHAHITLPTPTLITITLACTQVLWCLERLTRPTVSCCETTRTRLTICLPAQPSVCEAF